MAELLLQFRNSARGRSVLKVKPVVEVPLPIAKRLKDKTKYLRSI